MQPRCRPPSGLKLLRRVAFVWAAAICTVSTMAMRIVIGNDDGFESRNIQALYTALKAAGHDVILSAPFYDQSATSAMLGPLSNYPRPTTASPGGLIAAGVPGVGPTTIAEDQYYVNGSPVAAILYGIEVAAKEKWNAAPDLVITGPNVGNNLGTITSHSGTIGAAITALNRGIPALAMSGANGDAATAPLLAEVTLRLLAAIEERGRIVLPAGIGLNVNVPVLDPSRAAASYPLAFTQIADGSGGESWVFNEGNTVTVSPIQGTYQATPEQAALTLGKLRTSFRSTLAIANPKLINISVRGFVGTGSSVQIAGFYISGSAAKTVLIRASGPALVALGVTGSLADPVVELYDKENRLVAANDNWGDDAAKASAITTATAKIGAFAATPGSKDAALIVTLSPGAYTVVIKGAGSATGVALVEIYDINVD